MGATAFQKGLGGIHALAHPVGANYNTHHGMTNAVVMPALLKFNRVAIEDRITAAATGETPKGLSLAPMRTCNGRPLRRANVSGPTKGTVGGKLATMSVRGKYCLILALSVSLEGNDHDGQSSIHPCTTSSIRPADPAGLRCTTTRPPCHPPTDTSGLALWSAT